ncbi:MAG: hypothetical protein FWD23_19005, partial [Oscillospiraceae bacterium]|nr:hypothetical protein [Oscillospiraceae bacterium]
NALTGEKIKHKDQYVNIVTPMKPLITFVPFNISTNSVESIEKTISGETIVYKVVLLIKYNDSHFMDVVLILNVNLDDEFNSMYVDINDYYDGELKKSGKMNVTAVGDKVKIHYPDLSDYKSVNNDQIIPR